MSESILRVLLDELQTLRIACKCGTAIEIPIASLDRNQQPAHQRLREVSCPGCGLSLRLAFGNGQPPAADAFDHLVKAWQSLRALSGNASIQFIVEQGERPAKQ